MRYYAVLHSNEAHIPDGDHIFGYTTNGELVSESIRKMRKWGGKIGEAVEARDAEDGSTAQLLRLRFSDGYDKEWFFPWMLREVSDPRFHTTLPPIYGVDADDIDDFSEMFTFNRPRRF